MRLGSIFYYFCYLNILIIPLCIFSILACIYYDQNYNLLSYFIVLILSFFLFLYSKKTKFQNLELNKFNLFLFLIIVWFFYPLMLSIPYWFGGYTTFTSGYFETMSGFTSYGVSVFTNIDDLDKPILLWRSFTQVCGSIFFLLSVLSILGQENLNIFPLRFLKLEKGTVFFHIVFKQHLSLIVYALTLLYLLIICILNFTGLNLFDKINLTNSIISSGGFVTNNFLKISDLDKLLISVCLIICSLNYFILLKIFRFNNFFSLAEDKRILLIIFLACLSVLLIYKDINFIDVVSSVSTSISSSGINFAHFQNTDLIFFFLLLVFIGSSMLSPGSGFKYVRLSIIFKKILLELNKVLYPSSVINMRALGSKEKIINNDFFVSGTLFISYLAVFIIYSLTLTFEGIDFENSFKSTILILFNTLPSDLYLTNALNYSVFSDFTFGISIFTMVASKMTPLSILSAIKYSFIRS